MAHVVKALATKPNDLSSVSAPTWQKERANFYKLSSDILIRATGHIFMHIYAHTNTF